MRYVRAYRAESCPRYLPEEVGSPAAQTAADLIRSAAIRGHSQPGVAEHAVLQSTLWAAARDVLAQGVARMIEVRWVVHDMGRISPWLLVAGEQSGPNDSLDAFQRALPRTYQWVDEYANIDARIGPFPDSANVHTHWFRTKLIRRRLAVHLPRTNPVLTPPPSLETVADNQEAFGERFLGGTPHVPITISLLPEPASLDQGIAIPFVVPLVDDLPDRRRLCSELISACPAIISCQMWPIPVLIAAGDRWRADLLRRFWEVLSTEARAALLQGGESAVRATLDRYARSPQELAIVETRIYAKSAGACRRIAIALANQNGGLHCFQLDEFDKAGPISGAGDMSAFERVRQDVDGRRAERDQDRAVWAALHGVRHTSSLDDDQGFVYGLRSLYTSEEAETVLRLPFAFEAGLPGLNTHLVAPFRTVPQERLPVFKLSESGPRLWADPPPSRIRVGVPILGDYSLRKSGADDSKPRLATDEWSDTSVWHSMSLKNLTKHGLVVGSTGSGKTVTTTFLVLEAARNGIDVLVVEPIKAEYYDKFYAESVENRKIAQASKGTWEHPQGRLGYELRRRHFEGHPSEPRPGDDHLCFDPMRIQPHVTVARHISFLKACFESAFQMPDWFSLRIENALREYYTGSPYYGGCGFASVYARGGPGSVFVGPRCAGLLPKSAAKLACDTRRKEIEEAAASVEDKSVLLRDVARREKEGVLDQEAAFRSRCRLGVFPSLETFCDYVENVFLPRWSEQLGDSRNKSEMLLPFIDRFKRLRAGAIGQAGQLADQLLIKMQPGEAWTSDNWKKWARLTSNYVETMPLHPEFKPSFLSPLSREVPESSWNPFVGLVPGRAIDAGIAADDPPVQITVLELEALADATDKSLVMAFIMTFLYERRQAEDLDHRQRVLPSYYQVPPEDRPKHLLVLEEAHRLLSNEAADESAGGETAGKTASAKTAQMFVEMLAEIRALGQSILVVEQMPTKLAPDAIKNTNLKIMHRITSVADRESLGKAMNFGELQMEYVATLRPGQAVTFEEGNDQPILLSMPDRADWNSLFGIAREA
jgi:hypothetical protein